MGHLVFWDDVLFEIAWDFAALHWLSLFLPVLCKLNLIFQMILDVLQKRAILNSVNIFKIVGRF